MSTHPMIQPTDWSRSPEALVGAVSEQRRRLYGIVWDCALACTVVAPTLRHFRYELVCGQHSLALACIDADPSRRGYWRFRQDVPRVSFPHAATQPHGARLRVLEASARGASAPTVAALLRLMHSRRIGTAASTARLLEKAAGQAEGRSPLLEVHAKPDEPATFRVSDFGRAQLQRWDEAGLLPDTVLTQTTLDALADGRTSARDAFNAILGPHGEALAGALCDIEQECEHWRGLTRDEGFQALRRQQVSAPRYGGLPEWIDPERLLPPDHPLRAVRQRMEEELAATHPAWLMMEHDERARLRLDWCRTHASELGEAATVLGGLGAEFSALRYWLTGRRAGAINTETRSYDRS